jgi:hypothetical protein
MKIFIFILLSAVATQNSAFAADSSAAVKACLAQAITKDNPIYQVPEVKEADGYTRYLAVICNNDVAKDLFNSIPGPADAGDWDGKTRGDRKFLAEDGGASMCYHITRDSEGEKANTYGCSIRLNIDTKHLGKAQSGQMVAFPLKEETKK